MPRVSLVIPCFEQPDLLRECLRSVVAQSFADWEALVVDDGSSRGDEIGSVVGEVADERCRLIRHDVNSGLAAARNTGMRAARAELLLPVDCDDQLEPDCVDVLVATLERQPNADCVFADFRLFGGSDEVWSQRPPYGFPALLVRQTIPGPGTLFRRSVWERAGGYCESAELRGGNEDWDFWIAATASGSLRALHVGRALYRYRRHGASMSVSTLRRGGREQREFMYARHRAVFDRYGVGGRFRARGYVDSAGHAWSTGARSRAAALLLRGLLTPGVGLSLVAELSAVGRRRLRS